MRQTTGTRKSPGEKIVKDIKRATTARQHMRSMCERDASITHPRRRSGLSWTGCAARIASRNCAVVRVFPKASTTNGQRTSWKRASDGWLATRPVRPQLTKSKTCAERPVT